MFATVEKHDKIGMLASLSTISGLISKALRDDTISDEEYSQILLEFYVHMDKKTFEQNLRLVSAKTGNIETEAAAMLCGKRNVVDLSSCLKSH